MEILQFLQVRNNHSKRDAAELFLQLYTNYSSNLKYFTSQKIDAEYQRITDINGKHWRSVLKRILSVIRLLASRCLAFRGTNEHLFEVNNGNFLNFLQLFAEFDPIMEEHIRRIQRKSDKWPINYLSNNILDELINVISNAVFKKILKTQNIFR